MKRIAATLLTALVIGCAGDDHTGFKPAEPTDTADHSQEQDILTEGWRLAPAGEPTDAPGFSGFLDEEELAAYCEDNPDYIECGPLGMVTQPFTSHQYHGFGDEPRACYSTWGWNTPTVCDFPNSKSVKIDSALYDGAVGIGDFSAEQIAAIGQEKFNWVFEDGLMVALGHLHGFGGLSVSHSSGGQWMYIAAAQPTGAAFGSGGLVGGFQNRVMNAPVAPNGVDEGLLRSAHTSVIYLNPRNIVNYIAANCSGGANRSNVSNFAYNLTMHEFLHAMGFAHFKTGLMAPALGCKYAYERFSVAEGFRNALAAYSPTSPGINIQADNGLGVMEP